MQLDLFSADAAERRRPKRNPHGPIYAVIQRFADRWILDLYDYETDDPIPGSRLITGSGGNCTPTGGRLFPSAAAAEAHVVAGAGARLRKVRVYR